MHDNAYGEAVKVEEVHINFIMTVTVTKAMSYERAHFGIQTSHHDHKLTFRKPLVNCE